jgi:hypothetical protein
MYFKFSPSELNVGFVPILSIPSYLCSPKEIAGWALAKTLMNKGLSQNDFF